MYEGEVNKMLCQQLKEFIITWKHYEHYTFKKSGATHHFSAQELIGFVNHFIGGQKSKPVKKKGKKWSEIIKKKEKEAKHLRKNKKPKNLRKKESKL